jgi:lipoprotein-anchoring transpeptidase ErfK/SrfK
MRRGTRVGAAAVLFAAVLALCTPVGTALAAGPTVALRHVSWSTTQVQFAVSYPAGTGAVSLTVRGTETARVTVSTETAGQAVVTADMAKANSVVAHTYDEGGSRIATSPAVAFVGARYAPRAVIVLVKQRQLVGSAPSLTGYTDVRTTSMLVTVDGVARWRGPVTLTAEGKYKLPKVPLAYGANGVRVFAVNAWGSVTTPTFFRLYNLGDSGLLHVSRYVLVDKGDVELYVVDHNTLERCYPVAIGMFGTPTPTGLFVLGRAERGGGSWGILRMPLYRRSGGGLYASSYYIHGTNDPDSIGTMASHGCVRMYNQDAVTISRVVGPGVYVQIRE